MLALEPPKNGDKRQGLKIIVYYDIRCFSLQCAFLIQCSYLLYWELPNSRIWLAKIDIDHLDQLHFVVKMLQAKTQKYRLVSFKNIGT